MPYQAVESATDRRASDTPIARMLQVQLLTVGASGIGSQVYLINNSGGQVEISVRSPQYGVLARPKSLHIVCQYQGAA